MFVAIEVEQYKMKKTIFSSVATFLFSSFIRYQFQIYKLIFGKLNVNSIIKE
jgi:hypothetical protein